MFYLNLLSFELVSQVCKKLVKFRQMPMADAKFCNPGKNNKKTKKPKHVPKTIKQQKCKFDIFRLLSHYPAQFSDGQILS
jgi:hypothetical protein